MVDQCRLKQNCKDNWKTFFTNRYACRLKRTIFHHQAGRQVKKNEEKAIELWVELVVAGQEGKQ